MTATGQQCLFCSESIKDRSFQNIFNADREIRCTLANVWDSFGYLRVLLSASSAFVNICGYERAQCQSCVNLHFNLPLLRTRAIVNS